MTNVFRKKGAKVAVLLVGFVLFFVVTVFTGIDTANELYKPDVVEKHAAIHPHLQPAAALIDYSVLPSPSIYDENYAGNDRPHRSNKWRRDSSQIRSMELDKLMIDNGNGSQIDHEKREQVKEVNERRLLEI